MHESFLSGTLQVVLILNIVGIVAYFVIAAVKTGRIVTSAPTAIPRPVTKSLWKKLLRIESVRPAAAPTVTAASGSESLSNAFDDLRRVLNSYANSLN